jgi:hypothetical protein
LLSAVPLFAPAVSQLHFVASIDGAHFVIPQGEIHLARLILDFTGAHLSQLAEPAELTDVALLYNLDCVESNCAVGLRSLTFAIVPHSLLVEERDEDVFIKLTGLHSLCAALNFAVVRGASGLGLRDHARSPSSNGGQLFLRGLL